MPHPPLRFSKRGLPWVRRSPGWLPTRAGPGSRRAESGRPAAMASRLIPCRRGRYRPGYRCRDLAARLWQTETRPARPTSLVRNRWSLTAAIRGLLTGNYVPFDRPKPDAAHEVGVYPSRRFFARNRKFESIPLQRRVRCEPDFRGTAGTDRHLEAGKQASGMAIDHTGGWHKDRGAVRSALKELIFWRAAG
jgi:hypothetical protein